MYLPCDQLYDKRLDKYASFLWSTQSVTHIPSLWSTISVYIEEV